MRVFIFIFERLKRNLNTMDFCYVLRNLFFFPCEQVQISIIAVLVLEDTLSILLVYNWILTTNFIFLVQQFCFIFWLFLKALHALQQNLPWSKQKNSVSFGLFLGSSALRCLFNWCCVWCRTHSALRLLFWFLASSNAFFFLKVSIINCMLASFTVAKSFTWSRWSAQKYN